VTQKLPLDYKNAIQSSGVDIYSPIEVGDAHFWIPTHHLETLLNQSLAGYNVGGMANRTRSKAVKSAVCDALGYPTPKSFKKTQPRFLGQQLDVYVQKSNNLQIWNEELSPTRRYAIVQVSSDSNTIMKVKVVNGQELAHLDTTGTITTKYQAGLDVGTVDCELVSELDTTYLSPYVNAGAIVAAGVSPTNEPEASCLLPIRDIFDRLSSLIGASFVDPGIDQERNRGAELHWMTSKCLGYSLSGDNGQFPDIRHQLLEIKLQTSPTIDLGLILPCSEEHLDIQQIGEYHPKHCDARYAIFYANTDGKRVTLTNLYVATGTDFFSRFRRFGGKEFNGKIQLPLPRDFFET